MTANLSDVLVTAIEERPDFAREPVLAELPGVVVLPHDPPPLDWRHLVDAAAARLDESWVRPDLTGYMVASGLADELAATLCAYGMVASEVAHMHEHAARDADGQS
jgi:hypothetical protein